MITTALRFLSVLMLLAMPGSAEEAKPAPAAVRAKAVIIKKAAPAAAAEPAAKVEVKAEVIEVAPAKPAAEKAAADKPVAKADGEKKPVAPANLKGFGKNDATRKPTAEKAEPQPAQRVLNPNANPNADQIKQMAQQYKMQLMPVLTGELAFIRLMCDIPMEKRKAVRSAGLAVVDDVSTAMAEQQNRGRVLGAVRAGVQAKQQAVNDPPKAIRAALDTALREALTEDQLKVYLEEAEHRKEQRKLAAIHSVVARLDGMLCLTAEAREKITESIAEKWQEDWERWLQMHQYGDQYFPVIPNQLVTDHLNAEQKQVWDGLQKVNFGGWGNFGGGVGVADDGWWGEPLGGAEGGGMIFIEGAIGF